MVLSIRIRLLARMDLFWLTTSCLARALNFPWCHRTFVLSIRKMFLAEGISTALAVPNSPPSAVEAVEIATFVAFLFGLKFSDIDRFTRRVIVTFPILSVVLKGRIAMPADVFARCVPDIAVHALPAWT